MDLISLLCLSIHRPGRKCLELGTACVSTMNFTASNLMLLPHPACLFYSSAELTASRSIFGGPVTECIGLCPNALLFKIPVAVLDILLIELEMESRDVVPNRHFSGSFLQYSSHPIIYAIKKCFNSNLK